MNYEKLGSGKVPTFEWENTPECISNSEHPTTKEREEIREVGLTSLDMATLEVLALRTNKSLHCLFRLFSLVHLIVMLNDTSQFTFV